MFQINSLIPGYTQQHFSQFRSLLYDKAKEFVKEEGVNYRSYTVIGAVSILSKISEFIELPFKTVEDIALVLINLIGAL